MRILILVLVFSAVCVAEERAPSTGRISLPEVDALIEQLGHSNRLTRDRAATRLTELGRSARPDLLRACRHLQPQIAATARRLVVNLPWDAPDDPPTVRSILKDYGGNDWHQSVRQLLTLPQGYGMQVMARLIEEDPRPERGWALADHLLSQGSAWTTAAAAYAGPSETPAMRYALAMGLRQVDDARASKLAYSIVESPDSTSSLKAVDAIFAYLETRAWDKRDLQEAARLMRLDAARQPIIVDGTPRAVCWLFELHAYETGVDGFGRDLAAHLRYLPRPIILYHLGVALEKHQHPRVARLLFELAYWSGVQSPWLRMHAGDMLVRRERYDLAEREYLAMSRQQGFDSAVVQGFAYRRLHWLAQTRQDDKTAATYLQAAVEADGRDSSIAVEGSAGMWPRMGNDPNEERAQTEWRALRNALEIKDATKVIQAVEKLVAMQAYWSPAGLDGVPAADRLGRRDLGDQLFAICYDAALRRASANPGGYDEWNSLAWLCASARRRLPEGLAYAEKAVSINPNDAASADTLADLSFQLGHIDRAIEQGERAARLTPEFVFLKERLAKWRSGRVPTTAPVKGRPLATDR